MKTFYAVNLNNKYSGLSRWALYTKDKQGELQVVWATRTGEVGKNKDDIYTRLPGMIFHPRREGTAEKYPAYHFVVKGFGMDHLDALADTLARHFGEGVQIYALSGWAPVLGGWAPVLHSRLPSGKRK